MLGWGKAASLSGVPGIDRLGSSTRLTAWPCHSHSSRAFWLSRRPVLRVSALTIRRGQPLATLAVAADANAAWRPAIGGAVRLSR